MNKYVKDFLERHSDLIEDTTRLIEVANKEQRVKTYNDIIDTLVSAKIIDPEEPLAKHKFEFDANELEDAIEAELPHECRIKFLDFNQDVVNNTIDLIYVAQEDMYQEAADKIALIFNHFLIDTSEELVGAQVNGVAYCRSTPNKKFPVSFKVDANMTSYKTEYTYYVVFSEGHDMYASVDHIFMHDASYGKAYNTAQDLANNQEETILNDHGEGFIFLVRVPENININNLSGDGLMTYVEDEWDIWEG